MPVQMKEKMERLAGETLHIPARGEWRVKSAQRGHEEATARRQIESQFMRYHPI